MDTDHHMCKTDDDGAGGITGTVNVTFVVGDTLLTLENLDFSSQRMIVETFDVAVRHEKREGTSSTTSSAGGSSGGGGGGGGVLDVEQTNVVEKGSAGGGSSSSSYAREIRNTERRQGDAGVGQGRESSRAGAGHVEKAAEDALRHFSRKEFQVRLLKRTTLSTLSNSFDVSLSSTIRVTNNTAWTMVIRSSIPELCACAMVLKPGTQHWIPLHWLFPYEFYAKNGAQAMADRVQHSDPLAAIAQKERRKENQLLLQSGMGGAEASYGFASMRRAESIGSLMDSQTGEGSGNGKEGERRGFSHRVKRAGTAAMKTVRRTVSRASFSASKDDKDDGRQRTAYGADGKSFSIKWISSQCPSARRSTVVSCTTLSYPARPPIYHLPRSFFQHEYGGDADGKNLLEDKDKTELMPDDDAKDRDMVKIGPFKCGHCGGKPPFCCKSDGAAKKGDPACPAALLIGLHKVMENKDLVHSKEVVYMRNMGYLKSFIPEDAWRQTSMYISSDVARYFNMEGGSVHFQREVGVIDDPVDIAVTLACSSTLLRSPTEPLAFDILLDPSIQVCNRLCSNLEVDVVGQRLLPKLAVNTRQPAQFEQIHHQEAFGPGETAGAKSARGVSAGERSGSSNASPSGGLSKLMSVGESPSPYATEWSDATPGAGRQDLSPGGEEELISRNPSVANVSSTKSNINIFSSSVPIRSRRSSVKVKTLTVKRVLPPGENTSFSHSPSLVNLRFSQGGQRFHSVHPISLDWSAQKPFTQPIFFRDRMEQDLGGDERDLMVDQSGPLLEEDLREEEQSGVCCNRSGKAGAKDGPATSTYNIRRDTYTYMTLQYSVESNMDRGLALGAPIADEQHIWTSPTKQISVFASYWVVNRRSDLDFFLDHRMPQLDCQRPAYQVPANSRAIMSETHVQQGELRIGVTNIFQDLAAQQVGMVYGSHGSSADALGLRTGGGAVRPSTSSRPSELNSRVSAVGGGPNAGGAARAARGVGAVSTQKNPLFALSHGFSVKQVGIRFSGSPKSDIFKRSGMNPVLRGRLHQIFKFTRSIRG